MAPREITHLSPTVIDQFHRPPAFILNPHKDSSVCITCGQFLVWLIPSHQHNLTVVASQVEVYSLWCTPISATVTRGESHSHHTSPIACGQPSLFIVAPSAHRFLLLTLGNTPLPGQAEDVGIAAKHRPMFHCCIHTFFNEVFHFKSTEEFQTKFFYWLIFVVGFRWFVFFSFSYN